MVKINIFGDFVAFDTTNLRMNEKLSDTVSTADFNIINFEAPVETTHEKINKSGPNIFQSKSSPNWLISNGFNIITLANNHIMDFGIESASETLKMFNKVTTIGLGNYESAYLPKIIKKGNIKIALIAGTHYEFGVLGDCLDDYNFGTAWINHSNIEKAIKEVRNDVNYIILLPHAGIENIQFPLPEWRTIYKHYIDIGCDAIIASHPHIIQGTEYYKNKPICYSLGNFYFPWQNQPPFWYKSIGICLNLEESSMKLNVIPISFSENCIFQNDISEITDTLKDVDSFLTDDTKYKTHICELSKSMLTLYEDLLYCSGYWTPRYSLQGLKRFLNLFLKRFHTSDAHLLNILRCESHRFMLIRALRQANNIQ